MKKFCPSFVTAFLAAFPIGLFALVLSVGGWQVPDAKAQQPLVAAPKVTTTQRNSIVNPPTGALVFNTTSNQYEFYTGTGWAAVGPSASANWPAVNQSSTNPTTSVDPNDAYMSRLALTYDNSLINPQFTTTQWQEILLTYLAGLNNPGSTGQTSQAKTTALGLAVTMNAIGQGQAFPHKILLNRYGMGDGFGVSLINTLYGGVNAGSDEGQGAIDITMQQGGTAGNPSLQTTTISAVQTSGLVSTTLTQVVTRNKAAQTVTVAATTGIADGDWVTVGASGHFPGDVANTECVKVTTHTATSITGIFLFSHANGESVDPAVRLTLNNSNVAGQGRIIVNKTQASYSAGTALVTAGTSSAVGAGTVWGNAMVGGTASNIGVITFTPDDTTLPNAQVASAYYIIASVGSNTALNFLHRDDGGIASYKGKATTQGAYTIRPGTLCMIEDGDWSKVVVQSGFTWAVNDSVEIAISPEIVLNPIIVRVYPYVTGGKYDTMMNLQNFGLQTVNTGVRLGGPMTQGVAVGTSATAFDAGSPTKTALQIGIANPAGANIQWSNAGSPGIFWNTANSTLEMLYSGSSNVVGTLQRGKTQWTNAANPFTMQVCGNVQLIPHPGSADLNQIKWNATNNPADVYQLGPDSPGFLSLGVTLGSGGGYLPGWKWSSTDTLLPPSGTSVGVGANFGPQQNVIRGQTSTWNGAAAATHDVRLSWPTPAAGTNPKYFLTLTDDGGHEMFRVGYDIAAAQALISFFGAAGVPQQNTTGTTQQTAAGVGAAVKVDSTSTGGIGTTAYTTADVIRAMKQYGLLAN